MRRLLLVLLIALAPLRSSAQEACKVPSRIDKPGPVRDTGSNNIKGDSYTLSISWSPEFCASAGSSRKNAFQCKDNRFGFVVHGLWPQSSSARRVDDHPRRCRESEPLPPALLKQHLCMMPGVDLIQGEWVNHGTCNWESPEQYLAQTAQLWNKLKRPDVKALVEKRGDELKVGDLINAFTAVNPGLKPEHVRVTVSTRGRGSLNRLDEVRICYDKSFNYAACKASGTPATAPLNIRF